MKIEIDQELLENALEACKSEIDVLNDLTCKYGEAIENNAPVEEISEAAQYVLHCNDIIYKKLVFECGLSFTQGEALIEDLNLKAMKSAHDNLKKPLPN